MCLFGGFNVTNEAHTGIAKAQAIDLIRLTRRSFKQKAWQAATETPNGPKAGNHRDKCLAGGSLFVISGKKSTHAHTAKKEII